MKIAERHTAEYIRDFAEQLALMADEIKLGTVANALQMAALKAEQAIGRTRNGTRAPTADDARLDHLARPIEHSEPDDMERITKALGQDGERA